MRPDQHASSRTAFDRLAARAASAEDLIEILSDARRLLKRRAQLTGEELREHRRMLADATRVERFIAGIAAVVRPGDIVIDAGSGSGILSVAAARAGAARVYAVEVGAMADVARAVAAANGVADRVTVLQCDLLDVELPRPADVAMVELIGSDPWDEGLLEVMPRLNARLLKAGGRILPHAIALLAMPVALPPRELRDLRAAAHDVREWRERYGIDLQAVADAAPRRASGLLARATAHACALGRPAAAPAVALGAIASPSLGFEIQARCARAGEINAVAIGFDVEIAPGIRLSSMGEGTSWDLAVRALDAPVPVRAGQEVTIAYAVDGIDVRLSCASR